MESAEGHIRYWRAAVYLLVKHAPKVEATSVLTPELTKLALEP
jgi:hypothetical protein